jgi:ABC-type enterochelin transport system permease subunit
MIRAALSLLLLVAALTAISTTMVGLSVTLAGLRAQTLTPSDLHEGSMHRRFFPAWAPPAVKLQSERSGRRALQ